MFPFPFSFIASVADIPVDRIANAEAMSFNGTDQYIQTTSSIITGNNSRSISLWYKTTIKNTELILFSLGSPTDTTGGSQFAYCLNRQNNSDKAAIFGKTSNYDTAVFDVPITADGDWRHLVVTYDQSNLKVYIDGNLEATPSLPPLNYATSSGLTIGSWSDNNRYFNGSIDEVAIFNTALSADKIQQIYNATAVVDGVPQTANLFTGGLDSSLVYWNRMGDS